MFGSIIPEPFAIPWSVILRPPSFGDGPRRPWRGCPSSGSLPPRPASRRHASASAARGIARTQSRPSGAARRSRRWTRRACPSSSQLNRPSPRARAIVFASRTTPRAHRHVRAPAVHDHPARTPALRHALARHLDRRTDDGRLREDRRRPRRAYVRDDRGRDPDAAILDPGVEASGAESRGPATPRVEPA